MAAIKRRMDRVQWLNSGWQNCKIGFVPSEAAWFDFQNWGNIPKKEQREYPTCPGCVNKFVLEKDGSNTTYFVGYSSCSL